MITYIATHLQYTDNNPLTYILTSAKLDATSHHWLAALASYNFDIVYRSGINNADADGLSKLPRLEDYKQIGIESVRAICNCIHSQSFIQSLYLSADAVNDHLKEPQWRGMSDCDWRMAQ